MSKDKEKKALRCIGRTKTLKRCDNKRIGRRFCEKHRYQWILWLVVFLTNVATFGGMYRDVIEPWFPRQQATEESYQLDLTDLSQKHLIYTIRGHVKDSAGVPLEGVKLTISGHTFLEYSSTFGEFVGVLNDVERNNTNLKIYASKEGFFTGVAVESVADLPDKSVVELVFHLTPK